MLDAILRHIDVQNVRGIVQGIKCCHLRVERNDRHNGTRVSYLSRICTASSLISGDNQAQINQRGTMDHDQSVSEEVRKISWGDRLGTSYGIPVLVYTHSAVQRPAASPNSWYQISVGRWRLF